MRGVIYKGPYCLEFVDNIKEPIPSYNEVLIETKAVGICGSDLGIFEGEFPKINPPLIIGHEGAGIVKSVGEGVKNIKENDRVSVACVISCGKCDACKYGKYNLCKFSKTIGMIDVQGEYADFFVAPEQNCYILPENLSWTTAALIDTLAGPIYGLVKIFNIPIGSSIAVFGPGPAGLFFCKLAKLCGASNVYLVGTRAERLSLGKYYGADTVINVHDTDPSKYITNDTNGEGVDIVIDAAGTEGSLTNGLKVLRRNGTFIAYGVYPIQPIMTDMQKIVLEEYAILGYASNYAGYPLAIELLSKGIIDAEPLITHKFKLEELPSAFSTGLIKNRVGGYIKGVVVF